MESIREGGAEEKQSWVIIDFLDYTVRSSLARKVSNILCMHRVSKAGYFNITKRGLEDISCRH